MDKIKFYIKIYLMILSQNIKSKLQFRTDFIVSLIGMFATNLSGIIAFYLLFTNIPNINGWSYDELIFMYAFTLLATTPLQIFFDNVWNTDNYVATGDFIKFCFKPIDIFFYYMAENFDIKGLGQLLFGIITMCYAWNKLHIPITLVNLMMLVAVLVSASLIMISIMVIGSSSSFWIVYSKRIIMLLVNFKDYAKYPMTIFSGFFKFAVTFIIPVGFVAFYPSQFFLRPNQISVLVIVSPVIGIAYFIFAYFIWSKGASRYSGTGS